MDHNTTPKAPDVPSKDAPGPVQLGGLNQVTLGNAALEALRNLIYSDTWTKLALRLGAVTLTALSAWAGWVLWSLQPEVVDRIRKAEAVPITTLWDQRRREAIEVMNAAIQVHPEIQSVVVVAPESHRRVKVVWEFERDGQKNNLDAGAGFSFGAGVAPMLGDAYLGFCGQGPVVDGVFDLLCPIDGPRRVEGWLLVTFKRGAPLSHAETMDWWILSRGLSDIFYPRLRS